jgi:predicted nucleic acid-binding protein
MKVFFDSNIYVSEFAFGGVAARIVAATVTANWRIYVSDFVVDESCRVLQEDFHVSRRAVHIARQDMVRRATVVFAPPSRHRVPGDAHDDPILQGALSAGAGYLVSSDKHLLALHPYESVRIVSLAAYLQILRDHGFISSNS